MPIEVAEPERLTAIGLTGNYFGDLTATDDDAQSRRRLGDGSDRLARIERELPSPNPLVVEDLRITVGTRRRRKTRWLRLQKSDDDIVEGRRGRVGRLVRERLFRVGGEAHLTSCAWSRRGRRFTENLARVRACLNLHADLIKRIQDTK